MLITVASGKGGTGKTLIATSLAISLKNTYPVKLLDCDVEEPNDYIFLKPVITGNDPVSICVPVINEQICDFCGKCAAICAYKALAIWGKQVMIFPELCHGCGACSYLCPRKAISEQPRIIGAVESGYSGKICFVQGRLIVGEAMSPPVIRKVKSHADKNAINIIDAPPGTACPVITAVKDSDFCLLVTEPTPFGLNDLTLAVNVLKRLEIPCGVVINRNLGLRNEIEDYCQKAGIPVLLKIPLNAEIARLYSRGITLVEGMPEWQKVFIELFQRIQGIVYEGNSNTEW